MKNSLTKKFKIISFIIIISVILGLFLGYQFFNKNDKGMPYKLSVNTNFKKAHIKDAVIKSMSEKKELITLEAELEESITIDESWGNLSIFKKIQKINFYGKGIYSVDLSKISKDNIKINTFQNKILINLPKPCIKSISIDENKTKYQTVEKGILRFGQVKLLPEEYNVLMSEVKGKMEEKLKSSEEYNKALTSSKISLKNLIENSIKQLSDKNYNVEINFI